MERTPLQDAVDGWLTAGPMSGDELVDRTLAAGLVPIDTEDGFGAADAAFDAILGLTQRYDDYWTAHSDTPEEVVVLTRTFVDTGMTFTHRVTEAELDAEGIDLAPDLSVLDWGQHRGLPLDDDSGSVGVDHTAPGPARFSGPPGWIDAVRPGDLLCFTRTDGVVSAEVIEPDELDDGAKEIEALRDAASAWVGGGVGVEEVPILMEAMARDHSLFRRPVPPVGELLVAAGLERKGHEWGWADEEWHTRQERFRQHDRSMRRLYGFDHCCDRALDRVEELYSAFLVREEIDHSSVAEHLGHGTVLLAFTHIHAATPHLLNEFASASIDVLRGRQAAPALALLGMVRLRELDPLHAVRNLEAALRADPDLSVAAETLALLELDRGNLSKALSLSLQDGVEPHLADWINTEQARQSALRPSAGRNDPCPCGSGKKFKRCCGDGAPLALRQRVPFALERLGYFASGLDHYRTRVGLALSAAAGHEDVLDAVRRFDADPFLLDIAVHEGGLGEQYLEERGPLLPADEAEALGSILDEPRRLLEIVTVQPGEAITLRDTRSGERFTVEEHTGSHGREPGELLFGRVATVTNEPMLVGVALSVPLRARDSALRLTDRWTDAHGLATWFGSLHLPPRLTNREGEQLLLRRTICEVDDATVVATALDEAYDRQGGAQVWHEYLDGPDRVVRGTLRLDGSTLTIESNSVERQERLLTTLDGLFDYTIVEDGELDTSGPLEEEGEGAGVGPLDANDVPEEVRALLEQQILEYEQRWIDEPVPALGDLTPREALNDPTRREDLFSLLRELRSHEIPDGALGMSADRIEQLLGIERR